MKDIAMQPIFRVTVMQAVMVASGIAAAAAESQPRAVVDALTAPVLDAAGLASHEAVFKQVLAADEADLGPLFGAVDDGGVLASGVIGGEIEGGRHLIDAGLGLDDDAAGGELPGLLHLAYQIAGSGEGGEGAVGALANGGAAVGGVIAGL